MASDLAARRATFQAVRQTGRNRSSSEQLTHMATLLHSERGDVSGRAQCLRVCAQSRETEEQLIVNFVHLHTGARSSGRPSVLTWQSHT